MNKMIVYFSRFSPTTQLGGGARRAHQILEVLHPMNIEMISSSTVKVPDKHHPIYYKKGNLKYWSTINMASIVKEKNRMMHSLSDWKKIITSRISPKLGARRWHPNHQEKFNRLIQLSGEWARQIHTKQLQLAILDDPIYFQPLFERLKRDNIPVIAICHNLESLVPHQQINKHQDLQLKKEISILKQCDLVITISREETWLLTNFNIDAIYFRYYPVDEIVERMQKVRNHRKKGEKKDFLLIGSAINQATRQGMMDVIKQWKKDRIFLSGHLLLVAGFMSHSKLPEIKNEMGVKFLGQLPDQDLDAIMTKVKGAIVYQKSGSGALTRITEILLAGIPILINPHASRTFFNVDGIIEFDKLSQLNQIIKKMDTVKYDIYLPTPPQTESFLSEIKSKFSLHDIKENNDK